MNLLRSKFLDLNKKGKYHDLFIVYILVDIYLIQNTDKHISPYTYLIQNTDFRSWEHVELECNYIRIYGFETCTGFDMTQPLVKILRLQSDHYTS